MVSVVLYIVILFKVTYSLYGFPPLKRGLVSIVLNVIRSWGIEFYIYQFPYLVLNYSTCSAFPLSPKGKIDLCLPIF